MARGSRYKNERLVGPGNIDQLSYIDIAKANLHIGGVVPVPTVTSNVGAGTASGDLFEIELPLQGPAGTVLRVTNVNFPTATNNGAVSITFPGALSITEQITIMAQSEVFLVIPPDANMIRITHTDTTANPTFFRPQGSNVGLRLEWTLDN